MFATDFRTLLRRLLPYLSLFFVIQTLLRVSLLARALIEDDFTGSDIFQSLLRGLWFDCVTASFFMLPVGLYYLLLPMRWNGTAFDRVCEAGLRFLFSFALLYDAVAEHLFWTEFNTRFNFIAVDYLIYTQEVIGNIVESYPLPAIIACIALGAALISWISWRRFPPEMAVPAPFTARFAGLAAMLGVCGIFYSASAIEQTQFSDNAEAGEIAGNGVYNLFYAFWHNEISYERFYSTNSHEKVENYARKLLWEDENEFIHDDGKDLTRLIQMKGPEKRKNVILVVMESLSADYMQAFGNDKALTPNLDKLAKEGLFFTNLYATGTRTVRGLEAVTLSIPPTPGQSILRRPGNADLFSLGFIFQDRGYETSFLYGGYGYFDNMNDYFAGNGFAVRDRTALKKENIEFANVWGVCDEDLFHEAVRVADDSHAAKKPFMQLIMTTSNHRPFTYPEGRIDIPSKTGKPGGVKYADYSIGKLIEEAKTKPWFKDTVFIFVADHTAGAGGKAELDPKKYHIPMIFYAPGTIRPKRFTPVASQIDLAPILLGLLNFSYYTKFYGEDLLHDDDEVPHAFISNYQKVGLVRDGELTVLSPKRKVAQYDWPNVGAAQPEEADDAEQINDAVAYYQSASWWKEQYRRIPTLAAPR